MVGRENEKAHLTSLLKSTEHEFVAVFGRRRVGKTYLIRESYDYNFVFQHTGVNNNSLKNESMKEHQLDKFAESLETYGVKIEQPIKDWNEAFFYLRKVIEHSKEKKKVIFIDELSWMDTKGSGLISALESFWNGWVTARKEKDVILIVCTSATYSKHNMCSREYDWEEIEKSLISNGSW